ncbi:hypothetical protein Tsubulata_012847 [Turnera subulata]|uniref:Yippee domain-containing protein n=1 Tax=Turnera subulata TaxID=218843 RepID=A0A9Q0JA41_9ROSI|nr:hypothetical protein Tsubulata_012847 [Turnera subulata]
MGRLFVISLDGHLYSCKHCRTHLALADDIISKSFHSRHGRAYLFDNAFMVLGPDGSSYIPNQEALGGESDGEDA